MAKWLFIPVMGPAERLLVFLFVAELRRGLLGD
jgi:hypothetical protein